VFLCPHLGGGIKHNIKQWCCLTSVAHIGPKSRTERPRKTKIGIEVAHITRDSDITFKVKRSKVKVTGGGGILWRPPTQTLNVSSLVNATMSGSCRFSERWLINEAYATWLSECRDLYKARCTLCLKNYDVSNMGESAFKSHAKSTQHIQRSKQTTSKDNPSIAVFLLHHQMMVEIELTVRLQWQTHTEGIPIHRPCTSAASAADCFQSCSNICWNSVGTETFNGTLFVQLHYTVLCPLFGEIEFLIPFDSEFHALSTWQHH